MQGIAKKELDAFSTHLNHHLSEGAKTKDEKACNVYDYLSEIGIGREELGRTRDEWDEELCFSNFTRAQALQELQPERPPLPT